jgi:hypothetical protein
MSAVMSDPTTTPLIAYVTGAWPGTGVVAVNLYPGIIVEDAVAILFL